MTDEQIAYVLGKVWYKPPPADWWKLWLENEVMLRLHLDEHLYDLLNIQNCGMTEPEVAAELIERGIVLVEVTRVLLGRFLADCSETLLIRKVDVHLRHKDTDEAYLIMLNIHRERDDGSWSEQTIISHRERYSGYSMQGVTMHTLEWPVWLIS